MHMIQVVVMYAYMTLMREFETLYQRDCKSLSASQKIDSCSRQLLCSQRYEPSGGVDKVGVELTGWYG